MSESDGAMTAPEWARPGDTTYVADGAYTVRKDHTIAHVDARHAEALRDHGYRAVTPTDDPAPVKAKG